MRCLKLTGIVVMFMSLVLMSTVEGADMVGKPCVYKKVGERELKLYVVTPPDYQATDKRSAIVFFHGGGFVGGTPSQFNEQATYLASRGMVAVLVEYRFVSKKKAMEFPIVCIQDAKSAMRWVRVHAAELGVDPAKIAAGGGSAGGYLAAAVGMIAGNDDVQDDVKISAKPCAMVLFNPVLDLQQFAPTTGPAAELSRTLSPIENAVAGVPPAIVFFGADDKLGSCVNDFKAKLEKAGVRCEVKIYEGQNHGFFNHGRFDNKYYNETLNETDRFLTSLGLLGEKKKE